MSPLVVQPSRGQDVILRLPYTMEDSIGSTVLCVIAGISFASVLSLLIVMAVSAFRSLKSGASDQLMFVRTHVAAYFVSLLFSDFIQALGSLMSIQWVMEHGITLGVPCTAQGAIKNGGNVGTALWSMVIAIHTFCILFLGFRPRDFALYGTLVGVWSLVGFIVVVGPAVVETSARGPYFGIAGIWCWITDPYQNERLLLEYLWMFSSAFISFVLYVLVFLKLRGNIVVSGWRIRFRRRSSAPSWDMQTGKDQIDAQTMGIARQMLWYPIAYIVIILPIAVVRYLEWMGHTMPEPILIFSDAVFLFSGFINTILFCTTRRILPAQNMIPHLGGGNRSSDIDNEKQDGIRSSNSRHIRTLSSMSNESFEASRPPPDSPIPAPTSAISPRSQAARKLNANAPVSLSVAVPPSSYKGKGRAVNPPLREVKRQPSEESMMSSVSHDSSTPLTAGTKGTYDTMQWPKPPATVLPPSGGRTMPAAAFRAPRRF